MESYMSSRVKAPHIHNLDTIRNCLLIVRRQTLFLQRSGPLCLSHTVCCRGLVRGTGVLGYFTSLEHCRVRSSGMWLCVLCDVSKVAEEGGNLTTHELSWTFYMSDKHTTILELRFFSVSWLSVSCERACCILSSPDGRRELVERKTIKMLKL
jgi:hypothetical protein